MGKHNICRLKRDATKADVVQLFVLREVVLVNPLALEMDI